MSGVPLTALYVPGDRPDRFDKAAASGADVVVLDLEDAVVPAGKPGAREAVVRWLVAHAYGGSAVQVRVNAVGSPWHVDDLDALQSVDAPWQVRLPKVESSVGVDAVVDALGDGVPVHAIIETARGVEALPEVVAHPAVVAVGLGETDLRSDLRLGGDRQGGADVVLDTVRARLVVAARAAGLPAPMMSVWPHLADPDGLATHCRRGRAMGFVGCAAVHPRQLDVIVTRFSPTPREVQDAREVLDALRTAEARGRGVAVLASGAMVDGAMRPAAEQVLDLAAAVSRWADRGPVGRG